jgi:hypothetical protein
MRLRPLALVSTLLALAFVTGCDEDDHGDDHNHGNETEIISRVELVFTPAGGSPVTFSFDDPDGEGGQSGVSDDITLSASTQYTLDISFFNALEEPIEDITEEVREEAEEHFVFVYGDAVAGPASTSSTAVITHEYADLESDYAGNAVGDDLPVGLMNTLDVGAAGSGELTIMLRHLPELNGTAQKTGDLPGILASGGALPGDVDANVTFAVTVE